MLHFYVYKVYTIEILKWQCRFYFSPKISFCEVRFKDRFKLILPAFIVSVHISINHTVIVCLEFFQIDKALFYGKLLEVAVMAW